MSQEKDELGYWFSCSCALAMRQVFLSIQCYIINTIVHSGSSLNVNRVRRGMFSEDKCVHSRLSIPFWCLHHNRSGVETLDNADSVFTHSSYSSWLLSLTRVLKFEKWLEQWHSLFGYCLAIDNWSMRTGFFGTTRLSYRDNVDISLYECEGH